MNVLFLFAIKIAFLLKTFHIYTGQAYVIVWRFSTHRNLPF